MSSGRARLGHGIARGLGIKPQPRYVADDPVTRGESAFSVSSAHSYVEEEPHTLDWFREITPTSGQVKDYFKMIFPFINWIHRYNWQWFLGDMIAGITIGCVVVPQGMSYASLAYLPPQFGLYTAFMGVMIYWLFATSKDITIGPVAVMSLLVGNIVTKVQAELGPAELPNDFKYVVAQNLAVIGGSIVCFMGITRLGFIVEFISLSAVTAFICGAALSIGTSQLPGLLGISSTYVSNHDQPYVVLINTIKFLPMADPEGAGIGVSALAMLYLIRMAFNWAARRWPAHAKVLYICNTMRTAFVILLYVLISWAANHNIKDVDDNQLFKLLGDVPRGFQRTGAPYITTKIISTFVSELPALVIVMLIEHIAIAKSFGRINGYTINPSQELIAIGVTNIFGPFLGAYPATGSFSRTAIKSKAGVRTPIAGVITGIVVLLAIYVLPPAFYWIPTGSLNAVVIHAVGDLITPPKVLYQFWRVSPLEVLIFTVAIIGTVFDALETGIYTAIAVSAAVLLFRVAKAKGHFLGKVKIHSVVGDEITMINQEGHGKPTPGDGQGQSRIAYLPFDQKDGSNPELDITAPYPGVFIYRFSEGFNYPNAGHYLDPLVQEIFRQTRRTKPLRFNRPGDRPWNNPGPKKGQSEDVDWSLPTLKAIIFDFASVNNVDVTAVQYLIDIRNQLDRYAAPDPVEWHFASISNRWTKRALTSAGFGNPPTDAEQLRRWRPLFNIAEMGGSDSAAAEADARQRAQSQINPTTHGNPTVRSGSSSEEGDVEKGDITQVVHEGRPQRVVVHGLNRPFFHLDITSALQSTVLSIETRRAAGELHEDPNSV